MFGRWITGLIVVALAVGVWVLWPRDDTNSTTTTTSVQAAPTTSAESTTTTTAATTTTTTEAVGSSDVIETVEEAEVILRELWFGWFEGIYNQDEDRIKEVVASQSQLDAAVAQFGVMEFAGLPLADSFKFKDTDVLLANRNCLAIWSEVQVSDFATVSFSGVHVFRPVSGDWKLISIWELVDDLWEQECAAQFG